VRAVLVVLGLLRLWRTYSSEQALRRHHDKVRRKPPSRPPARMHRRFTIHSRMIAGREVVGITPKDAGLGRVLYIAGGAYVFGPVWAHWRLVGNLSAGLGLQFMVPRYPLAPEHTVIETMAFTLAAYRELAEENPGSPLIVMGDSAGGGLSLAMLQEARRLDLPMPDGLVLISPWLDATMSAPGQLQLEAFDPLLRRAGLVAAAQWYAGELSLKHPWVSPLNGSLEGMPPILMFGGDRDILVTDGRRLAERAVREKHAFSYREARGLFHDWPLVPSPEARAAQREIEAFVAACQATARA
jgi:monoterpene epsilon-lactone hydrolase